MALSSKSLILYGIEVTDLNRSLDFRIVALGPIKMATLRLGFYSLTSICTEIARAMNAADTTNNYSASSDRTISGGTENRISITTSGGFLELDFASGPRTASTVAPLIGFLVVDYTGSTTYTGSSSAGSTIIPDFVGYNYLSPDHKPKVFGSKNVSSSGLKEVISFQIQRFINIEFKYESATRVDGVWVPFVEWAIQGKPFDFTPEIESPNIVFEVTLDSSPGDGSGLGWAWREQLPDYPDNYTTGGLILRLTPQ